MLLDRSASALVTVVNGRRPDQASLRRFESPGGSASREPTADRPQRERITKSQMGREVSRARCVICAPGSDLSSNECRLRINFSKLPNVHDHVTAHELHFVKNIKGPVIMFEIERIA